MKILFCDNTLWGLVNFRGAVIAHLRDKGHQVVLVAPEKEDKQLQTKVPEGIKYIPISMGRTSMNPWNDLKLFVRLYRIYRKERPDYIFHYTIKPNIYGSIAAKACGIPSTAMMAGMGFAFAKKSLLTRLIKHLYTIGLRCTDKLLVLNEENRQDIIKTRLCTPEKIIKLDGGEGVDCSAFPMYNNESTQTTFLFVGRILWEKGYKEFVEAARIVKQKHPDAQFCIVGALDPAQPHSVPKEELDADIRQGTVQYKGFINDMRTIYAQSGLVITLPSFYREGMNRALMEACASGKPIITTNIAGCRELVTEGKNGFIIPIKESEQLAKAMIKYLNLSSDEKAAFSRHSREMAESKFNILQVLPIYEQILFDAQKEKVL